MAWRRYSKLAIKNGAGRLMSENVLVWFEAPHSSLAFVLSLLAGLLPPSKDFHPRSNRKYEAVRAELAHASCHFIDDAIYVL